MVKLLMIMHLIILCTSCIAFMLVSQTYVFEIDPAEQGHEKPPEAAPVEGTNTEQEKGKPQCI
jgi:hypothetical protein